MYDTILVPLDGSPFAEQVLPLAGTVARKSGMSLELVKVHRTHPAGFGQEATPTALDVAGRERAQSGEYLRRTAEQTASRAAVRVARRLLDDPSPVAEAICGEAERVNASLIAMTTHGRTGFLRAVHGSVADGVLKHATLPVLLWRPGDAATPATDSFSHVVVALDGSTWAEMVLPAAAALAHVLEARMTLLRVVAPVAAAVPQAIVGPDREPIAGEWDLVPLIDADATQRAVERAQGYMDHVVARVRLEHPELPIEGRVLTDGHAAGAILQVAGDTDATVVAMTTHGRGTSRLILGSTVDRVLGGRRGATLLVHPTLPIPRMP